jgi:hypothetical protein
LAKTRKVLVYGPSLKSSSPSSGAKEDAVCVNRATSIEIAITIDLVLSRSPSRLSLALEELLVSSLAQIDALAKLLIEKGITTREKFIGKLAEKRGTCRQLQSIP